MLAEDTAGALARERSRQLVVVLGVLLLSPVFLQLSPYGQPVYRYEAGRAGSDSAGFQDRPLPRGAAKHGLQGVTCVELEARDRACAALDRFVGSGVRVDDLHEYRHLPLYAYHDGEFYEWNRTWNENDSGRLVLQPVDDATVLSFIAEPLEEQPAVVRRAVSGEPSTTYRNHSVDGRVVVEDGTYWVLSRYEVGTVGPDWLRPVTLVGAAVGLLLLIWAWAGFPTLGR